MMYTDYKFQNKFTPFIHNLSSRKHIYSEQLNSHSIYILLHFIHIFGSLFHYQITEGLYEERINRLFFII